MNISFSIVEKNSRYYFSIDNINPCSCLEKFVDTIRFADYLRYAYIIFLTDPVCLFSFMQHDQAITALKILNSMPQKIQDIVTAREVSYFMEIFKPWIKSVENYPNAFVFPVASNSPPYEFVILTDADKSDLLAMYQDVKERNGHVYVQNFLEELEARKIRFTVLDPEVINVFDNEF